MAFPPSAPPAVQEPLERARGAAVLGRELFREARCPGVISFAEGGPPEDLAPLEAIRASLEKVIREQGTEALRYEGPEGYLPLREALAGVLAEMGVPARADELLITSGTQQAIYLAATLLLQGGDRVLVEAPGFVGALGIFEQRGCRLVPVGLDGRGLRVADVDHLARRHGPALLFVQPTFQNPTGQTLPLERRRLLLELCGEHRLPILEDGAYHGLSYGPPPAPPLRGLEGGQERVVFVSSFTQFMVPGLRLGYLAGPPAWIEELRRGKEMLDLHSPGLIQRAAHHYLTRHDWRAELELIRRALIERRDAVAEGLAGLADEGLRWRLPEGGLFFWLELPEGVRSLDLVRAGLEEGVAVTPGETFYPSAVSARAVRLNFALHPPEVAREGLVRLTRALRRVRREPPASEEVPPLL